MERMSIVLVHTTICIPSHSIILPFVVDLNEKIQERHPVQNIDANENQH